MFPNLSNFLVLVALFGCWPDQVACRDDGMPLEPQQFVQEILRMAREGQLNGFLEMLQIQPSGNQVPSADNTGNQTINSRFFLYNNSRNLLNRKEIVVGDADSLNQSGFNASRPTKILLHPWMGIPIIPPLLFPFSAKNAYLTLFRDAYNVVIMDYTRTTGYPIYPIAATRGFEEAMNDGTQFLTWLHNERMIDLNQTHIIGLSLGAHIGSAIAKQVNETTGVAVGRTTGLDPAGPLFFPKLPVLTPPHVMNASDARYVDVGHTNAFLAGLGIMQNVGQADFYLNGGINQPPCQSLNSVEASGIPGVGVALATICSHLIAGEYYSYSILRARFGRSRPRCACSNIVLFYANPLCCDQRVIFGENSQRGTSGVLYMNYDFVRS